MMTLRRSKLALSIPTLCALVQLATQANAQEPPAPTPAPATTPTPPATTETPAAPADAAATSGTPTPAAEPPAETAPATTPAATPTAQTESAPAPQPVVTPPPVPDVAPANPLPVGLKVTSDIWTRYELRDGFAELGASSGRWLEGDTTFYRARLGLATTPLEVTEGVSALVQFTPQASGFVPTANTTTDRALDIHEAYLRLLGTGFNFDVGRFEMVYGDHLVIGNLDWHQTARAFDGARFQYKLGGDGAFVDAFFTQVREGYPANPKPVFNGDLFFAGVYAGLGPMVSKTLTLDAYALARIWGQNDTAGATPADPPSTADAAMETTLGARVMQEAGILFYRVEGGVQFGQRQSALRPEGAAGPLNPKVLAGHIDGTIGAHLSGFHFDVGGAIASGANPVDASTNEGWAQLYPTAHKFFGLMDIFGLGDPKDGEGRTNLVSANARIKVLALKPMAFIVDGHIFQRLYTVAVDPAGNSATFAGGEVDTNVIWNISDKLNLRGLYGFFVPNADHYGSDRIANYVELQFGYLIK